MEQPCAETWTLNQLNYQVALADMVHTSSKNI